MFRRTAESGPVWFTQGRPVAPPPHTQPGQAISPCDQVSRVLPLQGLSLPARAPQKRRSLPALRKPEGS